MKRTTLYNKSGYRGEGDRHSFAFFVIGAIVVLVAVFLIGMQLGRVIEKSGPSADNRVARPTGEPSRMEWAPASGPAIVEKAQDNVQKEIGAFSEDALKVPVVPPPKKVEPVREPGETLTFQDTLSRKNAEPVGLEKPKAPAGGAQERPRAYHIQAGAFREREKAENVLRKLEKAGIPVRIARPGNKGKDALYHVVAGPMPDRESARVALRKMKTELKLDAYITPE